MMFDEAVVRERMSYAGTLRSMVTMAMPLATAIMRLQNASEGGASAETRELLSEAVSNARVAFSTSLIDLSSDFPDVVTRSHMISSGMEIAIFVADYALSEGQDPEQSWQQHLLRMSANRPDPNSGPTRD